MHQNCRVYGSRGMADAVADRTVEGMDPGTTEARGGRCDSDPAPEVGGRLELDPGCSSL
jgi:hypothetical protein